jgi:hypothetical protein
MMQAPKRRFQVVHSLDEIPSAFASEDDERDWWAEHELSGEVWDQLKPTWRDIRETRPLYMRASNLTEVEFPLSVAKRHLSLIRRRAGKTLKMHGDIRLEHASIAIMFSAAAVEAGLNLFLSAPVLLSEDDAARPSYAKSVARQISTWSATQKLDSAFKAKAGASSSAEAYDILSSLFERRNLLAHAGLSQAQLTGNYVASDEAPSLGPKASDIDDAARYYHAARSFLDQLLLAPRPLHVSREAAPAS